MISLVYKKKKKKQFQLLHSKAGIVPQIHSTSITLCWVQLFHSLSSQCSSQDPYSTVPFIHNVSSQCFFLMVFIFYSPFWDHSKLILSFNHTIASSSHHSPLPSCSAHFHIFSLSVPSALLFIHLPSHFIPKPPADNLCLPHSLCCFPLSMHLQLTISSLSYFSYCFIIPALLCISLVSPLD